MQIKIVNELGVFFGQFKMSNWPKKKILEVIYFTCISTALILAFKLFLKGHSLRSTRKSTLLLPPPNVLLDLHNFKWLMNNDSICELNENTSKLMTILVHTSRDHFTERQVIRETWGSVSSYNDWSIRVVFLLGDHAPSDSDRQNKEEFNVKSKIEDEFANNGDMVMGSFLDTYKNLSYKHTMGYKWILEYCSEATYVWKMDDDMFVNVFSMINWRQKELDNLRNNLMGKPKLIDMYCPILYKSKPQRETASKWYIPPEVWPFETYPTYCSGWVYGISVDWIRKIYSVSTLTQVLWIDDLFVTGVLINIVNKQTGEQPTLKVTWSEITSNYNPTRETFCKWTDNKKDLQKGEIGSFGAFVRLLRGDYLVSETNCIWSKVLEMNNFKTIHTE